MPNHLFVYGTLHPDKAPPEIKNAVKKMSLLGKGRVWGKLVDLGAYPGAMLGKQYKKTISGLIFSLPDGDPNLLNRLDRYEEFFPDAPERSLFLRRQVEVELEDQSRTTCWIYEWNRTRNNAFTPAIVGDPARAIV